MTEQNRDGSISDSSFWLSWKSFIILITAVTLITAGYGYAIKLYIPEPQEAGTFGDSFGALTSLFTAFAFAGLIFTLFIQKNELSLQREEFHNLVNEQRGSKEQLENQFRQLTRQSFDNKFFNLLGEIRNVQRSCRWWDGNASWLTGFPAHIRLMEDFFDRVSKNGIDEAIARYKMWENFIRPYPALVNRALTVVFDEFPDDEEADYYISIIECGMSVAEQKAIRILIASQPNLPFISAIKESSVLGNFNPDDFSSEKLEFVKKFYMN